MGTLDSMDTMLNEFLELLYAFLFIAVVSMLIALITFKVAMYFALKRNLKKNQSDFEDLDNNKNEGKIS